MAGTLEHRKPTTVRELQRKQKVEHYVIAVDEDNYLTTIEATHGLMVNDQPFSDIMPSTQIVQSELE